jgi:hypothetical protein
MFAPRGIRNNNFGNIEDGPFARGLPGYVGGDGRFAQFDSPDNGMNAMTTLLGSYGRKGINSINGVINRWAPSSDGNNVSAYAQHVSQVAGVDPNAPIDLSDPATRLKSRAAWLSTRTARLHSTRPTSPARLRKAPLTPRATG